MFATLLHTEPVVLLMPMFGYSVDITGIVIMTTVVCYGVGDDEHIMYIDTAR